MNYEQMAKSTPIKKDTAKLEAELAQAWRDIETLSVVELAGRNSGVAEYVRHWEGRAIKAEEQVEALRKPLTDEQIRDLWSWSMTAEAERTANTQQHAFARAIEAAHGIKEDKT
jgi:hypothetical protein